MTSIDLTLEALKDNGVGEYFKGCTSLTNAKLKATSTNHFHLTSAFSGCTSLTEATIECPGFVTSGSGQMKDYPYIPNTYVKSSEKVTPLFDGCPNLKKVYIKSMVVKDGTSTVYPSFYGSFVGCDKLEYVEFPGTVKQWLLSTYGFKNQDAAVSFKQNTKLQVKCNGGVDDSNSTVTTLSNSNYKTYLDSLNKTYDNAIADL